jgi:cell division protein FtsQ
VLALVGLVVVTGAWVVLGTGVLAVRDVHVTGTTRTTPAEVVARAGVPAGTPMARVDTAAVARRVRSLPVVRTVAVERDWPHTLRITVAERRPAAVQRQGAGYELVDPTGVPLGTVARRPRGLPLVSVAARPAGPALRAALGALDDVPPGVRGQVVEVRAVSAEQVTLRLTRDRTVLWGSADRGARKGQVLAALLSRRASVYDVTAPDVPTTRR